METIKKMALVLTAIITAATALTACGGSSDNGSTADAGATTTAAASADESKAEEKKEDESKAEEKKEEESKADESKADEPAADTSKDKPAKKGKSVVAKKKEEAPEPPAEEVEQSSILVDAFANTVWVGMDSDYNCYALFLGDEEIQFMADDGSEISGYWGVADGDPNIYIFSDAELTDCIFVMPFTPDVDNNLLIINDTIVLTPTEATDAGAMAEEMEKTATSCKVAAYLDGTYWAGYDENAVYAMSLEGNVIEFYSIDAENGELAYSCYWSMDSDGLQLYVADEEGTLYPVMTCGVTIAEDGSAIELSISTDSGVESVVLNQVSESDAQDIVSYLHSLLEGGAEGGEEAAEGEEEYAEEETEEEE